MDYQVSFGVLQYCGAGLKLKRSGSGGAFDGDEQTAIATAQAGAAIAERPEVLAEYLDSIWSHQVTFGMGKI